MRYENQIHLTYSLIYDYFINHGYFLYETKFTSLADNKQVFFGGTEEIFSNTYITKVDKKYLLTNLDNSSIKISLFKKKTNLKEKDKSFSLNVFKHLLETMPENKEYLIKNVLINNISSFFSFDLNTEYPVVFDILYTPGEEKQFLTDIDNFLPSSFGNKLNYSEFYKYLVNKNNNTDAVDKFFISFLYKRQSLLLQKQGEDIRDFLIKEYNNDIKKLEPYFSFFPKLEKKFIIKSHDGLFKDDKFSCSFMKFDVQVFNKHFCIDNFHFDSYMHLSKIFFESIKSFYNIEDATYEKLDKSSIVKMVFIHNNKEFNNELLRETFIKLLDFLYEHNKFVITKKNITLWLQQDNLKNSLPKNNKQIKTLKI